MGCPERELASHLGGFDELAYSPQQPVAFRTCLCHTPHIKPWTNTNLYFFASSGVHFFSLCTEVHTYMIMHLFYFFIF